MSIGYRVRRIVIAGACLLWAASPAAAQDLSAPILDTEKSGRPGATGAEREAAAMIALFAIAESA